jgi:hypothetical protein
VSDGEEDVVKVYESHGETASYVCLSHCWGAHQPIRTIKANLQDHKQGIARLCLPKSFQDAVSFVRRLRIRYLWIDSLCIVQDDGEDWQRESGKMCSVFAGAILTIAASKSSDARGGLFTKTRPEHMARAVQTVDYEGQAKEVYVRQPLPHITINRHEVDVRDGFPLLSRSWVYQERLLPTRVLHFGPEELFWECVQETQCECSTFDAADGVWHKPDKEQIRKAFEDGSIDEVAEEWRAIITRYSSYNLSFASDKLPALSGIAKFFQQHRNNDTYVAGLWKETLIRDLLWRATAGEFVKISPRRPQTWTAPSWSWASVAAEVYFAPSEMEFHARCRVRDVQCELAGLDTTGAVRLGHLKIHGQLFATKAEIREVPAEETPNPYRTQFGKNFGLYATKGWNAAAGSFSVDYDLSCTMKSGETLYCLLVGKDVHYETTHYYYYLVLKLLNAESGTFERVGLLEDELDLKHPGGLRFNPGVKGSITII